MYSTAPCPLRETAELAFVIKLPQPRAEQAAAIYIKAFYKPWRCMSLTTCLIAREPRSGDRLTIPKRQNYQHSNKAGVCYPGPPHSHPRDCP
jgi:hypothetical protein